jgi:hypothetical protein
MDSHLEGNYPTEEATTMVDLVSQCLQYEPRDRPNTKKLVSVLEPMQIKSEVTFMLYFILFKNASYYIPCTLCALALIVCFIVM